MNFWLMYSAERGSRGVQHWRKINEQLGVLAVVNMISPKLIGLYYDNDPLNRCAVGWVIVGMKELVGVRLFGNREVTGIR